MSETVIRGLTLEEYARFSAEAGLLRMRWEQSEGKIDIKKDMLAILAKYKQDPKMYSDEDGLNYHMCGMIHEWHELINKDADMMVKYSQISGEVTTQALYGEGGGYGDMKTQIMGEAVGSPDMVVEDFNLEKYAQSCAALQHTPEAQYPEVVKTLGYKDMDHFQRVQKAFNDAMSADTSLTVATKFGQYFAQYGTAHMAAGEQFTKDVVAEHIEAGEARDDLQQKATRQVVQMAVAGNASGILDYLKKTFPEDADDADAIDWYLDKACDLLAEAGNRDAATAVLGVRYDLTKPEEKKKEWIASEFNILFG